MSSKQSSSDLMADIKRSSALRMNGNCLVTGKFFRKDLKHSARGDHKFRVSPIILKDKDNITKSKHVEKHTLNF